MVKRSLFIALPLVLLISLLAIGETDAQCVMCKAVAEKGKDDGQEMAKGLNAGILYLMGIPYALILSLILVFFRKRILSFFRELKKA
ncbi:MAG: hypothetical protein ABEH38_09205 [Flavobacteriales bacterium]